MVDKPEIDTLSLALPFEGAWTDVVMDKRRSRDKMECLVSFIGLESSVDYYPLDTLKSCRRSYGTKDQNRRGRAASDTTTWTRSTVSLPFLSSISYVADQIFVDCLGKAKKISSSPLLFRIAITSLIWVCSYIFLPILG